MEIQTLWWQLELADAHLRVKSYGQAMKAYDSLVKVNIRMTNFLHTNFFVRYLMNLLRINLIFTRMVYESLI